MIGSLAEAHVCSFVAGEVVDHNAGNDDGAEQRRCNTSHQGDGETFDRPNTKAEQNGRRKEGGDVRIKDGAHGI